MRKEAKLQSLCRIAAIREAQGGAAEMRLDGIAARQRQLLASRQAQQERLGVEEQRWSDAVGAPRLNLELANAWSATMALSRAALARFDREIHQVGGELASAQHEWRLARARIGVARRLVEQGNSRIRRQADEAAANQLADQLPHRGRA